MILTPLTVLAAATLGSAQAAPRLEAHAVVQPIGGTPRRLVWPETTNRHTPPLGARLELGWPRRLQPLIGGQVDAFHTSWALVDEVHPMLEPRGEAWWLRVEPTVGARLRVGPPGRVNPGIEGRAGPMVLTGWTGRSPSSRPRADLELAGALHAGAGVSIGEGERRLWVGAEARLGVPLRGETRLLCVFCPTTRVDPGGSGLAVHVGSVAASAR